jgi:hypothetical protein
MHLRPLRTRLQKQLFTCDCNIEYMFLIYSRPGFFGGIELCEVLRQVCVVSRRWREFVEACDEDREEECVPPEGG